MFLGSKLINTLIYDHGNIRQYLEVLLDKKAKFNDLKESFYGLLPEMRSHNKREEVVVYKYMHNKSELKPLALEGKEEHHVLDVLVKELDTNGDELEEERWRAKAAVLAELIQNHLEEEEGETFPALKKYLTAKSDELLCQKYEQADKSSKKILDRGMGSDTDNSKNVYN